MSLLTRMPVLLLGIALGGCSELMGYRGHTPAEADVGGSHSVQLHNDGTVGLANLRVTTGKDVPPLTRNQLLPGERTATATVRVLHEYPVVTATIHGRTVTFQPVEGFSGFNAQLPPGRYVIRLRYVSERDMMDARVVREP